MSTKRPQIRSREPASVRETYEAMQQRLAWLRDFHADELNDRGRWTLALVAARNEAQRGGELTPLSEVC